MNKLPVLIVLLLIMALPAYTVNLEKKEIRAIRVANKPVIDGKLDDPIWKGVPIATDFIQNEPDNGSPSNFKTEVKFVYTDDALVVGVMMYDPDPKNIFNNLSKRDEMNNTDFVLLLIDPFNNGLDAFEFAVTPAGVQWDAKVVNNREDSSWDGVWRSATEINGVGWSAEFEIPYSALRFPKKDVQVWGLNVIRNVQKVREKVTWNFIDKEEDGWINQSGVLKGIENVNPPVRLSFTPYFSVYMDKSSDESKWEDNYRGGMDLKYGINESYTLDMMLIPDFGQVQSDDEVLNLSPYETKFDEKRQFFTEATELFNRGNIFYSRRIGGRPMNKWAAYDNLGDDEIVTENPIESKIINATKVSGRNANGLGIGVLNAMTKNTYATIKDTISGESRKVKTQPFTNYNMFVIDKSLKNESYISFFNTNRYVPEIDYMANVAGTEFVFKNAERSHRIIGKGIFSKRMIDGESDQNGHYHQVEVGKISGKFTWDFFHRMISDDYNPNDMGFLHRNNQINNNLNFFYSNHEPKGKVLTRFANIRFHHETRYEPKRYARFTIFYNARVKFKDHTAMGMYGNIKPIHHYDYNEPRVAGMKLRKGSSAFGGAWISSDYRKAFAIDVRGDFGKSLSNDDLKTFSLEIEPRYRFNDRFTMNYKLEWDRELNELGYASSEEIDDVTTRIYIGERNTSYLENRLSANFIFNNKSSLSLRARHYWAKAEYENFYTLKNDGRLAGSDYDENHDINFNSFNLDMVYSWRFAPGSELAVVWKNSIFDSGDQVAHRFVNNLKNTFDATQFNSLSLKVIYYIDYMSLKRNG
ncbi:DUF5916 domain-containing protein [Marinifilum caeruleilacunae]|uniref:Hydrolase n=1 Tax=Marinifilum caeruleilacunae TaxID=2499076 RepID=A0ABX1WVM7_9BACT|nr:DUF5916 domain-containing protein [Marinifilum caeruleilacunae]NOU60001.1 hypothetical protein [Marinifilum caeruleilacunae]